jgi:hypothetical protein
MWTAHTQAEGRKKLGILSVHKWGRVAGEEVAEIDRGWAMNQHISLGTDSFAAPDQFCQSDFDHGNYGWNVTPTDKVSRVSRYAPSAQLSEGQRTVNGTHRDIDTGRYSYITFFPCPTLQGNRKYLFTIIEIKQCCPIKISMIMKMVCFAS